VALLLMVAHAGALMCQSLVYGVAMNSKKNSLLALLIASNFTEIKGTVFKRYDPTKIFTLTCQDIVERFHLYIIMLFVLVEEAVGSGQPLPSPRLVVQCLYVLFAEIVIDVTKVRIISMSGEFLSPSHAIKQTHTNSHKLTHTHAVRTPPPFDTARRLGQVQRHSTGGIRGVHQGPMREPAVGFRHPVPHRPQARRH